MEAKKRACFRKHGQLAAPILKMDLRGEQGQNGGGGNQIAQESLKY